MHGLLALLLFSFLPLIACSTHGAPAQAETSRAVGSSDARQVPVRPDQAPLVDVGDALESDSLLGRRVRVAGRCTVAGQGHRAGFWTLAAADAAIEVRGQVPSSCAPGDGEDLVIFAQVEAKSAGSRERLLLRLPD
jgi:hypothetical protein